METYPLNLHYGPPGYRTGNRTSYVLTYSRGMRLIREEYRNLRHLGLSAPFARAAVIRFATAMAPNKSDIA